MGRYVFKKRYKRILMRLIDIMGYIIFAPLKLFRRLFSNENTIKKILVMRIDQMGDVIQTLPFFEKLAKKYPGTEICALTAKASRFLLENNPYVKKVFSLESSWFYKGKKIKIPEVLGAIRELKNEKIDLAFELRGDIRNIFFLFLSGAKKICGYGCAGGGFLLDYKKDYDREEHEIDKNLKLIGEPPTTEDLKFDFFVTEENKKSIDEFLRQKSAGCDKIILVHPFAGSKAKMWPLSRYSELIQLIAVEHENTKIFVTGSEAEKKYEDQFIFGENIISIIGMGFGELLALIKKTDIFLGNDSSIQHFAAYSGVKCLVIYGNTLNYKRWEPKVKKENFIALSRETDCGPCELPDCNQKSHVCMDIITVEEVYDKLKRWF